MNQVFFDEHGLPNPDLGLGCGAGSHVVQTGAILKAFKIALPVSRPDCVVVAGDANWTLACGSAVKKPGVNVAPVEAGLRSGNPGMPEDMNWLAECMDTLSLWMDAAPVLTDSGGLQDESTALGVSSIMMLDTTERPVMIAHGTNMLAGCRQPPGFRVNRFIHGESDRA